MNPQLPRPKETIDFEWEWPSWKFQLPHDALFTTLHDRFNTRSCAIQDAASFHYDVRDCGETSATLEEFYSKMTERREQRIRELEGVWQEIRTLLGAFPSTWDCPRCGEVENDQYSKNDSTSERWGAFCQLSRTMSFDSLVRFFDGYVRDQREREAKKTSRLKKMKEKWSNERQKRHDLSCAVQEASPPPKAACLSVSPQQSHNVTADHDASADQQQSKSCPTSLVPDTTPTHGDIILLPASAPHMEGSTYRKSTSPARPTAKRKNDAEEPGDKEEYAQTRSKRRRIFQDIGQVCAGIKEASPSRDRLPREDGSTSKRGVSRSTSPCYLSDTAGVSAQQLS